jgi:hypothetical protein
MEDARMMQSLREEQLKYDLQREQCRTKPPLNEDNFLRLKRELSLNVLQLNEILVEVYTQNRKGLNLYATGTYPNNASTFDYYKGRLVPSIYYTGLLDPSYKEVADRWELASRLDKVILKVNKVLKDLVLKEDIGTVFNFPKYELPGTSNVVADIEEGLSPIKVVQMKVQFFNNRRKDEDDLRAWTKRVKEISKPKIKYRPIKY